MEKNEVKKLLKKNDAANVRRVFEINARNYDQMAKLKAKMSKLQEEYNDLKTTAEEAEAIIVRKTGGYRSNELLKWVAIPAVNIDGSAKLDKNGEQIIYKRAEWIYPETLLPVVDNTHAETPAEMPAEGTQEAAVVENNAE